MRIVGNLTLSVFLTASATVGCVKEKWIKFNYCERSTNHIVENDTGRVYFKNIPDDSFYYIGGPDSTSREYAYIPCQDLENAFKSGREVGVLVVYSGTITRPFEYPRGLDPLFSGINLTRIKKAN